MMLCSYLDAEPDLYYRLECGRPFQEWLTRCLLSTKGSRVKLYLRDKVDHLIARILDSDGKLWLPNTQKELAFKNVQSELKKNGIVVEVSIPLKRHWDAPMGYLTQSDTGYRKYEHLLTKRSCLALAVLMDSSSDLILANFKNAPLSQRFPYRKNRFGADFLFRRWEGIPSRRVLTERSTSFQYNGYLSLYSLFSSSQFMKKEFRWPYLYEVSLEGLERSIYTHRLARISHAEYQVKSAVGSRCIPFGFGQQIDHLIQCSMWGETHGLPIGVAHSNLLCELLLNKVDTAIERSLASPALPDLHVLRHGARYFCFVDEEVHISEFRSILTSALNDFGLSSSALSEQVYERPYDLFLDSGADRLFLELESVIKGGTIGLNQEYQFRQIILVLRSQLDALVRGKERALLSRKLKRLRDLIVSMLVDKDPAEASTYFAILVLLTDLFANYTSYVPSTRNLLYYVDTFAKVSCYLLEHDRAQQLRLQRSYRNLFRTILSTSRLPSSLLILLRGLAMGGSSVRTQLALIEQVLALEKPQLEPRSDFAWLMLYQELYSFLKSVVSDDEAVNAQRLQEAQNSVRETLVGFYRQIFDNDFAENVWTHAAQDDALIFLMLEMERADVQYVICRLNETNKAAQFLYDRNILRFFPGLDRR